MKLLITRCLPDTVVTAARARFDVTYRDDPMPLSAPDLRAALREYDAVLPTLGDLFRADVFADVPEPRARILANFGVGYNHIDVAAARAAGLQVTNTPGAVTDATADIAMTLILMTARRASEGERLLRAGKWTGWHPTQMLGTHVTGKTVGIIGTGIANVLFYKLIQISSPVFATSVTYLIPVVAFFWGLLDNEMLTPVQFIGAFIILIGVYLSSKK